MTAGSTQRLASVDEANLVLDHAGQVNVFLIAGLLAPGGFVGVDGIPDLDALRATVGERIASLPQLRRIAAIAGWRHRWADASPDLQHHIRSADPVDGLPGLMRLCGELMGMPLPRDRPLWELLIVPGASADGVGIVLRIHHAIADGMAAVEIAQRLFDRDDDSAPAATPPSPLTHDSVAPRRRNALARLGASLHRIRMTLSGREVGSTVLLGDRGPNHGVAFLSADLDALQAHARTMGATVNDAVLAAAASGYAAALAAAGEGVPVLLPVSVPVALPRRGSAANRVGIMLVRLPLGESDPDERLRLIAVQTRAEKVTARSQGTLEFMRGPVGARIMDRLARRQHLVGGFVTTVPGPAGVLRLGGARVAAIWPVAVLAADVRLGVAAVSYDDRLCCGIHYDAGSVPGAAFATAVQHELDRMDGAHALRSAAA
ncbi:wax ester/triacylglycerol synthase domain-containing protein [Microbacterium pumilum]|uniref:diacylglycerol O-acyltransferase n=1 Tax=Microbacterium pumilum TaxID=344165 RepID=A0ABP5ELR3_9MICO